MCRVFRRKKSMKYAPFMIPLAFFRAGEGNFYKAGIESPVALASARLPGYRVNLGSLDRGSAPSILIDAEVLTVLGAQ
jgi:hypothetical protein